MPAGKDVRGKVAFDNRNLNERVYIYLRDKILNNELKPGERIDYDALMRETGVSRTPLRDAINRLTEDGLIEVKARSGSYVYMPNAKDVRELYDVRKALECQAVESAAPLLSKETLEALLRETEEADAAIRAGDVRQFFEADRRFHRTIIRHSGNDLLIGLLERLELKIQWFGVIITKFDRPQQANEQHKRILQALLEGDAAAAKRRMADHIERIKQFTIIDYSS